MAAQPKEHHRAAHAQEWHPKPPPFGPFLNAFVQERKHHQGMKKRAGRVAEAFERIAEAFERVDAEDFEKDENLEKWFANGDVSLLKFDEQQLQETSTSTSSSSIVAGGSRTAIEAGATWLVPRLDEAAGAKWWLDTDLGWSTEALKDSQETEMCLSELD